MKNILNIAGPIIVFAYTMTYAQSHPTATHYEVTTGLLIIVGCIFWVSYGVAKWAE